MNVSQIEKICRELQGRPEGVAAQPVPLPAQPLPGAPNHWTIHDKITFMVDLQSQPRYVRNAPTVLVIEDDGLIRQMLCAVFEAQDWETSEASDGEEGLEQVARRTPSLIILDLMMPIMDGFEFAEQLRKDPAYGEIPIIVLTAMVLDESDRARLRPFVQGIIEKGGSPNYLYNLLTQAKQFMN